MGETFPSGKPQLPEDLERLFSDPQTLNALIDNKEDAKKIVQELLQNMLDDSKKQKVFLAGLIDTLSLEDGFEETNRRDAALTIIKDRSLGKIIMDNSADLFSAYCQAIARQTVQNDPFGGSIAALLDAGIAIAPYLAIDKKQKIELKDAWVHVASQFDNDEERHVISEKRLVITQRISPHPLLDYQIEELILVQPTLENGELAIMVGATDILVKESRSRLHALRRIKRKNDPVEDYKKFDAEVARLAKNGWGIDEIADFFIVTTAIVRESLLYSGIVKKFALHNLPEDAATLKTRAKKISGMKSTRSTEKTQKRREQFIQKVKELNENGIAPLRIAKTLGVTIRKIEGVLAQIKEREELGEKE